VSGSGPGGDRRGSQVRLVRLGLRANLGQFLLLVAVSALVGATVGQERAILPILASRVFGLRALTTTVGFVAAYGLAKAATNLIASAMCERVGRRPVMLIGWLVGVPVPLLLIWAPSWSWVIVANLVLGIHDGLVSTSLVVMKIDLVEPGRRGLAMGISEGSGYLGVSAAAFAASFIAARYGLRPAPFLLGLAYAGLGVLITALPLRETLGHARHESAGEPGPWSALPEDASLAKVTWLTSVRNRTLSACVQAGFFNNLNDAAAWGLFPLLFASGGLSIGRIGALTAIYPAVWGTGQLLTGHLSDLVGRRWVVAGGMGLQALALVGVAGLRGTTPWALALVVLGIGTAMVYPTLLAAVGDSAHPRWRAKAIGVYRTWRDLGLVAGALLVGSLGDAFGIPTAIVVVAAVTGLSGLAAAALMDGR